MCKKVQTMNPRDLNKTLTRHFRPVTPYAVFLLIFFAVLAGDLNALLVEN